MPAYAHTFHHAVRFPINLYDAYQQYLSDDCLIANVAPSLLGHRFLDVDFTVKDECDIKAVTDKLMDKLDVISQKENIRVKHMNTRSGFEIDLLNNGNFTITFP